MEKLFFNRIPYIFLFFLTREIKDTEKVEENKYLVELSTANKVIVRKVSKEEVKPLIMFNLILSAILSVVLTFYIAGIKGIPIVLIGAFLLYLYFTPYAKLRFDNPITVLIALGYFFTLSFKIVPIVSVYIFLNSVIVMWLFNSLTILYLLPRKTFYKLEEVIYPTGERKTIKGIIGLYYRS
ncbi:hypothetical protein [Thermococcus sp.]|uniref:hypothetical protein n=1 Tax=Thermococcus sp. TaxID=35749 RepID=UPI00260F0615|nr:hypothetical protein [Thermococcus sp.]